MKHRMPGSLSDAVTILLAGLGEARASEVISRTPSLIRKWSDPDSDHCPSVIQALRLDLAFKQQEGYAPVYDFYKSVIDNTKSPEQKPPEIKNTAIQMSAAVGALCNSVLKFTSETSESKQELSQNERVALAANYRDIVSIAAMLEKILQQPEQGVN